MFVPVVAENYGTVPDCTGMAEGEILGYRDFFAVESFYSVYHDFCINEKYLYLSLIIDLSELMEKDNTEKNKIGKIFLTLTRHGQTEDNLNGTLCGQQPGKLTSQGVKQAESIGKCFSRTSQQFDHIYVSDLGRTIATFEAIVSKAPHLKDIPTTYTPLIKQKSGGVLEGQPLTRWREESQKSNINYRQYKCQGGESLAEMNVRCFAFLKMLVQEHLIKGQKDEQKVFAVTHSGYLRQFHNVVRSIRDVDPLQKFTSLNCSFHTFLIRYPINEQQYNLNKVKIQCTAENVVNHLDPIQN